MNLLLFRKLLYQDREFTSDTIQLLKEIVKMYPAFTTAQLLLTKAYQVNHHMQFEKQKTRCAIQMEFREKLKDLLTMNDKIECEEAELKALMDPPPYQLEEESKGKVPFESLAKEIFEIQNNKRSHRENQQVLISSFVSSFQSKVERPKQRKNGLLNEKTEEVSTSLISETLAKIYIKQGLYEEAIEAYQTLILKYPKKIAYFAERIEEIKALLKKQ
ncbi:hypothetical protein K4L44_17400 [Halosquirtibacter laminarini]|uniref:Uncharacterized protein n=1 Tax=Halosquirtibacter laminarini TaxID=3374600 RepID=A0AC61NPH1_9BACT|nr:hypothetical protein K4L44_17400 [Prolixibacteraceae bacterium]